LGRLVDDVVFGGGMDLGNGSRNVVGTWLGRGRHGGDLTHAIFAQALFGCWSRGGSNLLNGRLVLYLEGHHAVQKGRNGVSTGLACMSSISIDMVENQTPKLLADSLG
jgi:hypothetical protein